MSSGREHRRSQDRSDGSEDLPSSSDDLSSVEDGLFRGQTYIMNGILMYRARSEDAWQNAVYHHDIRDKLITHGPQGQYSEWLRHYVFSDISLTIPGIPRARGTAPNDITSYHPDYENWGPERQDRPDILFQYLRNDYKSKVYTPNQWYDDDRIVLDMNDQPIKKWRELPLVLSSELEGFMMEGIRRLQPKISIKDFRARMPKIVITGPKNESRRIYGLGTLAMRMSRFRLGACCVAWGDRDGSDSFKDFIDKLLPESCHAQNSTKAFRDLTTYEAKKALEVRKGKFLSRAGPYALNKKAREKRDLKDQKEMAKLKEEHDAILEAFQARSKGSASSSAGLYQRRQRRLNPSSGNRAKKKRVLEVDSGSEEVLKIPRIRQTHRSRFASPSASPVKRHRAKSPAGSPARRLRRSSRLSQNPSSWEFPASMGVSEVMAAHRLGLRGSEASPGRLPEDSPSKNRSSTGRLNKRPATSRKPPVERANPSPIPTTTPQLVPAPLREFTFRLSTPDPAVLDRLIPLDFATFAQQIDFSTIAPSTPWDEVSILAALHYTREDFRRWTGFDPPVTNHQTSYLAQYNYLQGTLVNVWAANGPAGPAPALFRLVSWGEGFGGWKAPVGRDGRRVGLPWDWAAQGGLR